MGHAHNTRFWYVFGFARNYLMIIPITFIRESPGISIVQPKLEQFFSLFLSPYVDVTKPK